MERLDELQIPTTETKKRRIIISVIILTRRSHLLHHFKYFCNNLYLTYLISLSLKVQLFIIVFNSHSREGLSSK